MNKKELFMLIDDMFPEHDMINFDGYEDCIVCVVTRFGAEPILCYDKDMVMEKKITENDGDYEQAISDFEHNMIGGWYGETTPCFVEKLELFQ